MKFLLGVQYRYCILPTILYELYDGAILTTFIPCSSESFRALSLAFWWCIRQSPDSFCIPWCPIVPWCLHHHPPLSMKDYPLLPQVDRLAWQQRCSSTF